MPGRTQQELIIETRKIFSDHGVVQLSDYVNEKVPIKFRCTRCGKEHSILWPQLVQGKNPDFICLDCSYAERSKSESHTYQELKEIFESKGSQLLIPEGTDLMQKIKTKSNVGFVCTYCGQQSVMQYYAFKRGRNQNLRCPKCSRIKNGNWMEKKNTVRVSRAETKQKNYEMIKATVESKGAVMLTSFDEYVDKNTDIHFGCAKCGKEYHIRWKKYEEGLNPNLLCRDCRSLHDTEAPTTEKLQAEFAARGSKLLNEYVNNKTKLLFTCSQCGNVYNISYINFKNDRNKNLLCPACQKGNITSQSPLDVFGTYSVNGMQRNKAESRARIFVKSFYNISQQDRCEYESHHIKPYKQFPGLIYSLGNLYPLPVAEHHTNNFNYYHKLEASRNPENWPDAARLPYHTYPGFKFFDLNKYVVTDFILEELREQDLYENKKVYADNGIFYVPLYFDELDVYNKAVIVYSMLREFLAGVIGKDIYRYTGQSFSEYDIADLVVKPVNKTYEGVFFEDCHIRGYVGSSVCLGAYTKDEKLVAAMSFSLAKSSTNFPDGTYVMTRFAKRLNTLIPGVEKLLFNAFVGQYDPALVVLFNDVRFASADPNVCPYIDCGFVYDGYSRPDFKYYKDGVHYSRNKFKGKDKLSEMLTTFDPNLPENMHQNGYIKLYDCGNFRYVWRRS